MLTTLSTHQIGKIQEYYFSKKKYNLTTKPENLAKYLPHLSCFTMWCDTQTLMPLWNGEGVSFVGISQKCIHELQFAQVQNMLRHILEFEF